MIPFFKRKTERGWMVIDAQADCVRVAHVQPGGDLSRVLFCEERPCARDDPEALQKIAREFHAERYLCTTLLDPADYQVLMVEAPVVRPEELKAAVRWRIKDMIDYHIDDAVVDVLGIPPADSTGPAKMMYAIAAKAETVKGVIKRFEGAGIPLQVIDIPEAAQRNLAARLESPDKGVVMLSFDNQGGFITFTGGGELYLSRRLDLTAANFSDGDEDRRSQHLERAALEVQRSLDHFERQFHYVTVDRILIAPFRDSALLEERLVSTLDRPVEAVQLDRVIDISGAPALQSREAQSRWLIDIGAGLRVESRAL
jgi:MSHA biogenesis protein MshI